jgi:serine/threonine protein kinase
MDLLRALDFLHNRNPIIIHRDLKPANLLLVRDLSLLKLTDFGMAKKVDRAAREVKQHKGYTGTVRYMAPEVISQRTGNYNERCDIYSASLIMWYIATCQRPPNNDISKVHERPVLQVPSSLLPPPSSLSLTPLPSSLSLSRSILSCACRALVERARERFGFRHYALGFRL